MRRHGPRWWCANGKTPGWKFAIAASGWGSRKSASARENPRRNANRRDVVGRRRRRAATRGGRVTRRCGRGQRKPGRGELWKCRAESVQIQNAGFRFSTAPTACGSKEEPYLLKINGSFYIFYMTRTGTPLSWWLSRRVTVWLFLLGITAGGCSLIRHVQLPLDRANQAAAKTVRGQPCRLARPRPSGAPGGWPPDPFNAPHPLRYPLVPPFFPVANCKRRRWPIQNLFSQARSLAALTHSKKVLDGDPSAFTKTIPSMRKKGGRKTGAPPVAPALSLVAIQARKKAGRKPGSGPALAPGLATRMRAPHAQQPCRQLGRTQF